MSVEQIIALDAKRLAEVLGLSVRTIRRLDSSGKLPRPDRIGRALFWCATQINAGPLDRSLEGERS